MVQEYDNKDIREVIDKSYDAGFNAAIEKACDWLRNVVNINQEIEINENGEPLVDSYVDYAMKRLEAAEEIINEFKEYMNTEEEDYDEEEGD